MFLSVLLGSHWESDHPKHAKIPVMKLSVGLWMITPVFIDQLYSSFTYFRSDFINWVLTFSVLKVGEKNWLIFAPTSTTA